MLRKLRRKFIALNMTIAALVLALAFGAICYLSYQQDLNAVYAALDEALAMADRRFDGGDVARVANNEGGEANADEGADANEASAGTGADEGERAGADENADASAAADSDASGKADEAPSDTASPDIAPPQIGGRHEGSHQVTPAAICVVDRDGESISITAFGTASVSEDVLDQAVSDAHGEQSDRGVLSSLGLVFAKQPFRSGEIIAFADASSVSSWQTLAWTLAGVGVVALAVFFVISVFFSRWALRPVERAWRQQQQFVADASHELKTPLTVILANTAILRGKPQASIASQSQWIESTQTEAERMQELVGDMLDLARPEDAARAEAERERVDLSDLVEGSVLQFESVAFERSIALDSTLQEGVFVQGDPKRLQRLASTLLDNACKYAVGSNAAGGDACDACANAGGSVRVTLEARAGEAKLTVQNSGGVIPPDDLPHVFDRFYRVDKARTASGDGARSYGLGLAIAREVAHEHGGSISAASSASAGTTFTVTLPLAE